MPYIQNTPSDVKEMLAAIGVKSLDELYASVPKEVKFPKDTPLKGFAVPEGLSEADTKKAIAALAAKNKPVSVLNSFLGAGFYDHYIPAALDALLNRAEFLTAYTPYQPEASQGSLQAIYEYQSYMCLLTGMDVSNASVFDAGSALAESALMALRFTGRSEIVIAGAVNPQHLRVVKTYLSGRDYKISSVGFNIDGLLDKERLRESVSDSTACVIIQSPNFFGLLENFSEAANISRAKGALVIMSANPMSFSLFKDAKSLGADICCGEGQPLGGSLNFGGPGFGYLTARQELLRQVPGRIVGRTLDKSGNPCYCLVLQAREQHIRRHVATSNICSNQSLNAIGAGIYLSLVGGDGLKQAGLNSFNLAHYLYEKLGNLNGVRMKFSKCFFNEFVWEINEAEKIVSRLYKKNIIAGYYLGKDYPELKNCILSCCTENKNKNDIDVFIAELGKIAGSK